jgi:hypothetical protein
VPVGTMPRTKLQIKVEGKGARFFPEKAYEVRGD